MRPDIESALHNSPLFDSHGRQIRRLRLSLTEHCNFRCLYCMPPEGAPVHPQQEYLADHEILRLAKIFGDLGITTIRLTGGEPTLKQNLVDIVARLSALSKIKTLALTTNGSKLVELAKPLRDAGLHSLNISLDSLNPHTFKTICKTDTLSDVVAGIRAAAHCGFRIKLNAVLLKGLNETELFDFVRFASDEGLAEMRFIEFMPLCGTGWKPELVLPLNGIQEKLASHFRLTRLETEPDSVAETFSLSGNGLQTRVGFIRTLSKPFCGQCSRIRLSATGFLQPCLFSHQGTALKPWLRDSASDDTAIQNIIRKTVWNKNRENEFSKASRESQKLEDTIRHSRFASHNHPSIRAIGG